MGHRHLFTPSFEMDTDQNRNHTHAEQPSLHLGRAGVAENGPFVLPMENMYTGGVHYASHWNSVVRSNEYSSPSLSMEVPHYRVATSGPSYDPFLQTQAGGSFYPVQQNYGYPASSSSHHNNHAIHGTQGNVVIPSVDTRRGPYKRKSPPFSLTDERGSTRRYYSAGSSSNASISPELQQEEQKSVPQHWPLDTFGVTPSFRGNDSLSIATEGFQRNVRSRSTLDLEGNLGRSHFSSNPPQHPHSISCPNGHSDMQHLAGLITNGAHRRIPASGNGSLTHQTNQILVGGSTTNGHYPVSSRNPIFPHPNVHGPRVEAVREGRNSYPQRTRPAYRATSSTSHLGYVATSLHNGPVLLPETYSFRHSRPPSTVGWRNSDRNGRLGLIANERYRSLSGDADANHRLFSQDLTMVGRSTLYGSRNLLDQHRDMRLDTDNMSYEELLALGERIGNVNTGLCEDLISKCIKQTIYCSSDCIRDEETCAICLEEYKNKEEIGELKKCGHNYHVGCIKKWLSMKNVCPICKAPGLEEGLKEK